MAALPCRRAQVPARPDRLGALAAARHVGPPRAPVRTRAHRRRHRTRASCRGGEGASRHPRQERVPRVRAPRFRRRDRPRRGHPVPTRARRHHRLFRRRPRHPRHAGLRMGGAAGGRGRPRGLHLHDRHPPDRAVRRLRLHEEGRRARRGRRAGGRIGGALRREARSGHRPRIPRRPLIPVERGHVHRPRRRAPRRDRREPAPPVRGTDGPRRGLGRPRRARPGGRPRVAHDHQDRDRLRRRRTGGCARAPGRDPRALRLGRRGGFRQPREAQLARARQRPGDPRRERAHPRRCVQRNRRLADAAGHQRDRRQGHHHRRHRGRAAGHHERACAAREGRRGRPQAHRAGATSCKAMDAAGRGIHHATVASL